MDFVSASSVDPDLAAFHLGLHCLIAFSFRNHQIEYTKGSTREDPAIILFSYFELGCWPYIA